MPPDAAAHRPTPILLVFNPNAGQPDSSPAQLMTIIAELQALNFIPQVFLIHPECDLSGAVQDALRRKMRLFVVSGGDGTIESVAAELAGTRAVLAVIPTGTANNVALSLNIPSSIPEAVALLRSGQRAWVDMGVLECCGKTRHFLEVCTLGLLSALFPSADDIQRGNFARIGDFLSTLVTAPLAHMRLNLDGQPLLETQGHVVVVTNMPYVGSNYPIADAKAYQDGLLDVMLFADLSKLEVLGSMVQMAGAGVEDPRIQRYRVQQLTVETEPDMTVMADGVIIGEGALQIHVKPRALRMVVGVPAAAATSAAGGQIGPQTQ